MKKSGFNVEAHDVRDVMPFRERFGVPDAAMSCHTAQVAGYVIEGHVPASDIKRLLQMKPEVIGLTAPGMPIMSPGMSSETPKDYQVIIFDSQGNLGLFSQY